MAGSPEFVNIIPFTEAYKRANNDAIIFSLNYENSVSNIQTLSFTGKVHC